MGGALFEERVLADIAAKHGRSPAQVVLRWHVRLGLTVVPKTSHTDRLPANLDVFDFALDHDMAGLTGLETGRRVDDQDPTYEEL